MDEQKPLSTMDASELLEALLQGGDIDQLQAFVYDVPSGDLARAVSLLEPERQSELLLTLPPETAAFLIDQLAHPQAADLLEELPAEQAAAIIDEMPSDEQADVFGEIETDDAAAILDRMDPEEAEDVRLLSQYPPDTAGGLMITEYLAYPENMTVDQALADVRAHADEYAEYDVQYMYVVSPAHELRGVARIRDIVLARGNTKLADIMIRNPRLVTATDTLDTLEDFFDAHYFNAVPVVDEQGKLLGVVRRAMVEEALGERADIQLLRFGGIIAGEELRTMPLGGRAMRRLAFLLPNILLSFIAVTIIAFYEASIEQIATLAVFLPLVANLSGAAGNQAVAVSIRELALGIVQPRDWLRVCLKEVKVGAINGVIIGAILCVIAALMMHGELMSLAWIVGGAYAMNSVLAVLIGGTLPLAAKALGADPAMISSPILTTLTDMGAFFLTLSMATTLVIAYLPPVT